jgi:uncharacterized protein (DUF952 family)
MTNIFHLTTKSDWERARSQGTHTAPSLKEEGFIHCCLEEQMPEILRLYYQDQSEVIALKIDTSRLESMLVYEWSPSLAQTFPHVYGPINVDSVMEVKAMAS